MDAILLNVILSLSELGSGNQDLEVERTYRENIRLIHQRTPEEQIRCYQAIREAGVVEESALRRPLYRAVECIVLARFRKSPTLPTREQVAEVFHEFGEDELAALYLDNESWESACRADRADSDLPS